MTSTNNQLKTSSHATIDSSSQPTNSQPPSNAASSIPSNQLLQPMASTTDQIKPGPQKKSSKLSNLIISHPPSCLDIDSINQTLSSPVLPSRPPLGALQLDIESDDEEEDDFNQVSMQDHSSHYKQFGDIENEEIFYSGYLLKKGERRKTWKKRWFVLRKTCLVYYKNEKEYRLLRIIPLNDIHTCAEVQIKQYDNTFGIVTPARTYYVRASSRSERNQWTNKVTMAKLSLKSLETHPLSVRKSASTPTTPSAITITDHPKYPLGLPPTPVSSPIQTSINPISIVQHDEPSSSSSAISWASDSFHLHHSTSVRPSDNTGTITKATLKRDMSLFSQPLDTLASPVSYLPTSASFPPHMSSTGSSTGNQPQSSERSFVLDQPSIHHHTVPAPMSSSEEDNEQEELPTPPVRLATSAPKSIHDNQQITTESHPLHHTVQERKVSLPEAGKTIIQGYLMKQGKRKNWRKRYFVLTSQKLVYSRTHMDVGGRNTRQIPIGRLLDALEHDQVDSPVTVSTTLTTLTTGGGIGFHHQSGGGGGQSASSSVGGSQEDHYFKIITSERTYLLNAPTEEDEIRWISAIRCLLKSYRANLPRSFDGILDHPIDSNAKPTDRLIK